MKKQLTPKAKVIKELAKQFELDLNKSLPITVQPDGSIVYKNYYIKENKTGNWAVYNLSNRDEVGQFFLKSCAIMAARAHSKIDFDKFNEIKLLDNKYWSNYTDTLIYENNIKTVKDFEKYCIMLTRLEHSKELAAQSKAKISRMFTWSFV